MHVQLHFFSKKRLYSGAEFILISLETVLLLFPRLGYFPRDFSSASMVVRHLGLIYRASGRKFGSAFSRLLAPYPNRLLQYTG